MISPDMGIENRLAFWKEIMGLPHVQVVFEQIEPEQITDDEGVVGHELIGITFLDPETRIAILFYTGDVMGLTDEEIVHELVHLRRPEWSDISDHHLIDSETSIWLEQRGSQRLYNNISGN